MFITSDRRLLRQVRLQVARHGFAASPYASAWTSLLIRRADEHLGITCLDSRAKLTTDCRGLVERMETTSIEVFRQIGTRTVFVVAFPVSDSERQGAAQANLCLLQVGQLAETFDILDLKWISGRQATSEQLLLAGQIAGTCRRFAQACHGAGDQNGAIAWRQRQLVLAPASFEVNLVLADLYAKRGDLGEAELCLKQLLKMGETTLPVLLLLADVKQRQGELIAAAEVAELAAARFPQSGAAKAKLLNLAAMRTKPEGGRSAA